MTITMDQLQTDLHNILDGDLVKSSVDKGELVIHVMRMRIAEVLLKLRDNSATAMNQLMDICGVDYPEQNVLMLSIIC